MVKVTRILSAAGGKGTCASPVVKLAEEMDNTGLVPTVETAAIATAYVVRANNRGIVTEIIVDDAANVDRDANDAPSDEGVTVMYDVHDEDILTILVVLLLPDPHSGPGSRTAT